MWHIFEITKKVKLYNPLVLVVHQIGLEPITY
jgi:hypothetical protein